MAEPDTELQQIIRLLVPINGLPPGYQDQVLAQAELIDVRRKDYVFRQGDRDNYTYYLLSGQVDLEADDQLIKRVEGGTGPAFHPLAQLRPRQMSAVARSPARLLRLDRNLLDRLLAMAQEPRPQAAAIEVTEIETAAPLDWTAKVMQSEILTRIPPANIQRLFALMEPVQVRAGQDIVRQGDAGDFYYILQSGRCAVTRRVAASGQSIKLAELGPGDSFGEEALVSNARRNATVTMLVDGELARLTKDHFVELIEKPLLHSVDIAEAHELVACGAEWVDVRFPEEHRESGVPGSLNVPLGLIRVLAEKVLKQDHRYVLYCDTGARSSVAAFLLAERGFDACYVEGGYLPAPVPASGAVATRPAVTEAPAVGAPAVTSERAADGAALAATLVASRLQEELARANVQLEQAMRLKTEADQARVAAERILEEKLRAERARLDAETERAASALAEAERLKAMLETAQRAAQQEAERRQREQDEAMRRMREESEQRLREEERRLEAVYARNAEALSRLQEFRAESEARLAAERAAIDAEASLTRERIEEARRREAEIELEEQRLETEHRQREADLKAAAATALLVERRRLEAEFARSAEQLAAAQRAREEAEAVRRAAAEEAARIVEHYKVSAERERAQALAQIESERERLQAEAQRIRTALEDAQRARDEAEASRRAALRQIAELKAERARAGHDASAPAHETLRAEMNAIEVQAEKAAQRYQDALRAQAAVENAQRRNEEQLEVTGQTVDVMRRQLQDELDEWMRQQDSLATASTQQETLLKLANRGLDARRRAEARRKADEAHTRKLLDEVARQVADEE